MSIPEPQRHSLLIPQSIASNLPAMVRNELATLDAQRQEEFVEEYERKAKSVGVAYLLWILLGFHYGYLGNWGMQVLYWLALWPTFGIWAIIDLFRIPKMVRNYNKDRAVEVLRSLKAVIR